MKQLSDRGFEEVAKRFRLLSDPSRLRILDLLRRKGEMPVGEIAEAIGRSDASASRQLAELRDAALLARRQEANCVYYSISAPWIFELCELVCGRLQSDDDAARSQPLFVEESSKKSR